jgi:beta-glucosidase
LPAAELNQVRHHAVLAHGLAVQAIRAAGRSDTKVGVAENMMTAVPVIDSPDHTSAAETATRELNSGFLTVMLEGRYTEKYLTDAGADAPTFTEDELRTIASPLHFVGINVYRPAGTWSRRTSLPATARSRSTSRTPRCSPRGDRQRVRRW